MATAKIIFRELSELLLQVLAAVTLLGVAGRAAAGDLSLGSVALGAICAALLAGSLHSRVSRAQGWVR